jgi:hypothetical protein
MVISNFAKTLIAITVLILFLALVLGAWMMLRAQQPMQVAQAGGMTFWDFISDRCRAQKVAAITTAQVPQQRACRNPVTRALPDAFSRAAQYTWRCLRAEADSATPSAEGLPLVQPADLRQAPQRLWAYFEAAAWQALVEEAAQDGECALAPLQAEPLLIAVTGAEPNTPQPTIAPMPTFFFPTHTPPAPVLAAGMLAEVRGTDGAGLRVRSKPGIQGEILFKRPEGELFQVVDGPYFMDDMAWWLVRALDDGASGWAAGEFLTVIVEQP